MYAIFRAGGFQFRAEADQTLRLPTMQAEPGDRVTFDEVLLTSADGRVHVGTPVIDGASVAAEVVRHGRGDKIVVYKMKRRKGYRKKQGHRQGFTEVRVVEIDVPSGDPAKRKKQATRAKKQPSEPEIEVTPAAAELADEEGVDVAEVEGSGVDGRVLKSDVEQAAIDQIDITDAARELAEENGLDLTTLEGTGKEGRILKSDVEAAIKEREG